MTKTENMLAFFQGKPYEWLPNSMDIRPFQPQEFPDNVGRGFVIQQEPYPKDRFGGTGWFGVNWFYDYANRGAIDLGHVIPDIAEWREKLIFPDLDAVDWKGIARKNARFLDHDMVRATTIFTGMFERLIAVLDFTDASMALADPDTEADVLAFFDALADFYIDYITRFQKYFGLNHLTFHDDWGTQDTTIISPETHRRMIMPAITKIVNACHRLNIVYEQHSCGYILSLLGNLAESGADTWQGQVIPGLKPKALEALPEFRFGLCPQELDFDPVGTDEEIEEALIKAIRPMSGSRYFLNLWDRRVSIDVLRRVSDRIRKEGFR